MANDHNFKVKNGLDVGKNTTIKGRLTINGDSAPDFRDLELNGSNPAIYFADNNGSTAWHLGQNGTDLYVLEDTNQDGAYETIRSYWRGSSFTHTGNITATSFSGALDYNDITNPPTIDNSVDYINAASFNTSTGVLTLSGVGRAGATVDLDNRYALSSDLGNYMPKQYTTSYVIPTNNTWGSFNLANGTMMQASGEGKPAGSSHGYWHVLGRRDAQGGYAGLYINSYQDAGKGLWIGRNDIGTAPPVWEKVWTDEINPVTGLTHDTVNTELDVTFADGTTQSLDLAQYLDDTNLARIISGSMNSSGIATFTRDDSSTFTVDMSVLLDDTNLSRIVSASWNTSNGVLTLTRNDSSTVAVDLDGRFVQKAGDTMTGNLTIQNNTPSLILVDTESANPTNQSIRIQHDALDANLPGGEGLGLRIDSTDTSGSNLNPAIITSGNIYANNTSKVFHDAYHPNADKWTTARTNTVTLTGDASGSGSASVDGTGNWTVSVPVVVNNDSHTHDGRYVNVTGDTMSGQLIIGTGQANPLELTRSSQVGIEFNDTSVGSRYLGVSGGVLRFGGNLNHGVNDRVFTDAYHPNADKWTTARSHTVTLTGDVTGSATQSVDGTGNKTWNISTAVSNDSHNHTLVVALDDRDMKPNTSGIQSNIKAMRAFFSSGGGMTGSANTDYKDVLVLDTYSDSSGGGPNAITFDKGSAVGDPQVHIWKGAWGGTTWGTGQRVFADNYHPNADKWTTARTNTVTLTGDASGSGSASVDGTGNWTVSVPVAIGNDSHEHSYIKAGGDGPSTENLNSVADSVSVGRLSYRGYSSGSTNAPPAHDNANGVITVGQHNGNYSAQLAFSSNANMYWRDNPAGVHGSWRKLYDTNDFNIANYDTRTVSDGRYVNVTGDTMTGTLTINSANDAQLYLESPDAWTGIGFNDAGANNEFIWHYGTTGTFAIGGGGSTASGKKLHVHGAMTIGSSYAQTSVGTNGLLVQGDITTAGLLTATQKSFTIDHPTKAGYKLRYGSLEGPENGVYVRGRLKDNNVIELPEVWVGLVHEDSITVSLTAIGKSQEIWVEDIMENKVIVGGDNVNCFYHVFAERKDVDKLVTEFKEVE